MADLLVRCVDLMQNYGGLGTNFAIASCMQTFGTLFSPYVRFSTVPDENAKGELLPFRMGHILIARPNLLKTRSINFVVSIVSNVWKMQLKKEYGLTDEEFARLLPIILINEGSMEAFAKNIDEASKGVTFTINGERKRRRGKKSIEDMKEELGMDEEGGENTGKRVLFNQFFYFNDEFGKAFKNMTNNNDYSYKLLSMISKLMTMAVYSDNTLNRGRIYIDGKKVVINSMIAVQAGSQLEGEFFEAGFSRRFLPVYEESKKQTNYYRLYSRDEEIVDSLSKELWALVEKMRESPSTIMAIPDGTDTENMVVTLLEEKNYSYPADQYVPMFAAVLTAISGINYNGGDFTVYTYKDVDRVRKIIREIYLPAIMRLYNESLLSYNRAKRDYMNVVSQALLNYLRKDEKPVTWKELTKVLNGYNMSDAVEALITLVNSGEITCQVFERKGGLKVLLFLGRKNEELNDDSIAMCVKEIKSRIY